MIHTNRTCENERAVSPVIGVMLMLVVVIIIAAVVSGFAGGLMGGSNKKAPTLTMNVKVVNTGDWHGSGFFATVTGVSEPIPTKDLKIVTSYNTTTQMNAQVERGAPITVNGGNTVMPNNGTSNINVLFNPATALTQSYVAPFGNGPGVNGTEGVDILSNYSSPMQQFGNYTLVQGTTLSATPCGAFDSTNQSSWGTSASTGYGITLALRYQYSPTKNNYIDPTRALLGSKWYLLEWGNTVNIKVIHIPTGKVIFNQDVPVTEQ